MISTYDIFKFLINNYKGETDFFSHKFSRFENANNMSHCNKNQHLIRANYTDSVYEVLIKLRENRVSMISIDRSIINPITQKTVVETVGLFFLSDIMSLMKQINFHEVLKEPVIKFISHMNGCEEDRKAFSLRMIEDKEAPIFNEQSDLHSESISNA